MLWSRSGRVDTVIVASAVGPQVESYANMVEPIVEALHFTAPMFFDVLTFVLLRRLAAPRRKMKEDQVNLADWCASLRACCS